MRGEMLLLRELVSTSPVWPSPYSVDMEKNLMRNCRGLSISYTSVGKTIYLATDHPKRTAPYCRHLTDQPQRTATPPIVPPTHGPATEEYPSAERYSSAGGPQGFISLEYQICPSRYTI